MELVGVDAVTFTVADFDTEAPFSPVQVIVKTVFAVKGPDNCAHAFVGIAPLKFDAGCDAIVHPDAFSAVQPTDTLPPLGIVTTPVEPLRRILMLAGATVSEVPALVDDELDEFEDSDEVPPLVSLPEGGTVCVGTSVPLLETTELDAMPTTSVAIETARLPPAFARTA